MRPSRVPVPTTVVKFIVGDFKNGRDYTGGLMVFTPKPCKKGKKRLKFPRVGGLEDPAGFIVINFSTLLTSPTVLGSAAVR